ncbi:hypothetical protein BS47DRAFT_1339322 [Hydnum rufescens UP504]|uniref:DNA-directed RNA polymerases I and III subunit RPAC2 n=1 Tax=Hydnum rufescens UP504 TaxID=1448309 RepID=A0A9P6B4C3_9AGAM|nr:hypothetical protein BS47DRAFT_1339322 [Hydnum rufescens UP504]
MEFPSVHKTEDSKIEILKGATADLSAATYCLHHETHTLGNTLRWMLMKNPKVEFCGYSVPHPSEPKIHLRIQMYDNLSSLTALLEALDNLDSLCATIGDAYTTSLESGQYETFDEKP